VILDRLDALQTNFGCLGQSASELKKEMEDLREGVKDVRRNQWRFEALQREREENILEKMMEFNEIREEGLERMRGAEMRVREFLDLQKRIVGLLEKMDWRLANIERGERIVPSSESIRNEREGNVFTEEVRRTNRAWGFGGNEETPSRWDAMSQSNMQ